MRAGARAQLCGRRAPKIGQSRISAAVRKQPAHQRPASSKRQTLTQGEGGPSRCHGAAPLARRGVAPGQAPCAGLGLPCFVRQGRGDGAARRSAPGSLRGGGHPAWLCGRSRPCARRRSWLLVVRRGSCGGSLPFLELRLRLQDSRPSGLSLQARSLQAGLAACIKRGAVRLGSLGLFLMPRLPALRRPRPARRRSVSRLRGRFSGRGAAPPRRLPRRSTLGTLVALSPLRAACQPGGARRAPPPRDPALHGDRGGEPHWPRALFAPLLRPLRLRPRDGGRDRRWRPPTPSSSFPGSP